MLNWLLRRIDGRIDALEREIEALTRDLDDVDAEVDELRYQLEQSVKNMAELQVEHMRRVVAIEMHVRAGEAVT